MILMIDNYDSFIYNIVQYLGEFGQDIVVKRNDVITVEEIEQLAPDMIVISPGPCSPNEAGESLNIIKYFAGNIPILGVCLGHQALAQVFGGQVIRAERLMHGKTSPVLHAEIGLHKGMPNPFQATRYHSLIVEKETLPACLEVTAWTEEGEIMGLRHKEYPIEGVQYHPESIMTEQGKQLLRQFIETYVEGVK
ncbi:MULTISPECIES: aminodeoxychorismate/anthranilate synthase component II [Lysinibacillus]|uniref:Anthranilate synthase component II n=1 Tax=Lysinibacillus boronitolerans JCM 21713 = 10a = NBRC 103108 TaxID=1294264 RepID=A0ABR4Y3S3_9BACI|nr:aminodeoxychorismate/anthranilate synthase component II [Lysinibacillus boronitolerans]KGR88648.1 anthranilate synthase component II [Lysinibacillus boronitolerans JCM 21713 = 10a = NBRC 103108]MCS1393503.1 aminodeoxychorismate/anthranilate synthase component II [Lysinibacillus boronitolerans]